MRYICINCNYLYDESLWDIWEGLEAWTTFKKMLWKRTCPSCWWSIDDFQWIKEEILYVEDKNNLSNFELKHIPKIEFLEDNKIKVVVWETIHPMEKEHFITSISLFDEYWELINETFLTYNEKPEIEFDIDWLDEFEVRARCNLHWLWSSWIIKNKN